jgi:hypothetical protein
MAEYPLYLTFIKMGAKLDILTVTREEFYVERNAVVGRSIFTPQRNRRHGDIIFSATKRLIYVFI